MLWLKLRNVLLATVRFRYALRYQSNNNSVVLGMSDGSSEYDSASRNSLESGGRGMNSNFNSLEKNSHFDVKINNLQSIKDETGAGGMLEVFNSLLT